MKVVGGGGRCVQIEGAQKERMDISRGGVGVRRRIEEGNMELKGK